MKFTLTIAFLLVNGLVIITGLPQYQAPGAGSGAPSYGGSSSGGSAGAPSSAPAPAPAQPQTAPAAPSVHAPAPAASGPTSYSSASASAGGGGSSSGGSLQVMCKRQETSPGQFKFSCDGVDPNSISLRSEHVLWLNGPEGQKQVLDIEIPNYKIEELIKAGFKTSPGSDTLINLLLKKPQQTYDAQVDTLKPAGGTPNVNLQYEAVDKTLVHFPNDKPYSPLTGPLLPPYNGGGGSSGSVSGGSSNYYAGARRVQ